MRTIIFPVNYICNLKCDYCYESDFRVSKLWPPEDVLEIYKKLIAQIDFPFKIIIHGGEPLLDPVYLLEEIAKISTGYAIQTNLTMLTDRHIDLFRKYNIQVGASYDGLYDSCRKTTTGKATSSLVRRNLQRLKEAGIQPRILVSLHKGNASSEELRKLLMRDLIGLRAPVRFNVVARVPWGLSDGGRKAMTHLAFLSLPVMLERGWRVKPFEEMIAALVGADAVYCCNQGPCHRTKQIISVCGNGDIRTCCRVPHYLLGNLKQISLKEAIDSPIWDVLALRYEVLQKGICGVCKFWELCFGGCTGDADDLYLPPFTCPATYSLYDFFSKIKEPDLMPIVENYCKDITYSKI
jgi:uncharacterized protein